MLSPGTLAVRVGWVNLATEKGGGAGLMTDGKGGEHQEVQEPWFWLRGDHGDMVPGPV